MPRCQPPAALLVALFLHGVLSPAAFADDPPAPTTLLPRDPAGHLVPPVLISVEGKPLPAWPLSLPDHPLTFRQADPASNAPPPTAPQYLRITCLDSGYGRLAVSFKDTGGTWRDADKSLHAALLDTRRPATTYQRCSGPFAGPLEVRIRLDQPEGDPPSILEVVAQSTPFPDKHFQYLLDEAWKQPYAGPSLPGLDNCTLKNRVMVGYQGWFRTPNDPYNVGWRHWGDIAHGLFTTDMWPDNSLYPDDCLDKAADVKTLGGHSAALFSPGWPEVAQAHFALMRKHGIDGAFVQRFVSEADFFSTSGSSPEWVLGNVREAANREGRLWAVEYDVSGCPDARLLDVIRRDWAWLVDHFGIRRDRAYAHENGQPVVFVWGMPLPDRHISVQTADAVVDFLKHDPVYGGNYVIGGLPGNWPTLDRPWQEHIARYDAALAWQSTRYEADRTALRQLGVDHVAHCFPGFSWANLKHLPTGSTDAFTPRAGGAFYETQLARAVAAGVDQIFVGMFDEYDEGTAILPMSDDPPPTNQQAGTNVRFFLNERWEGEPRDHRLPRIDLPLDGTPPVKGAPETHWAARFRGRIVPTVTGSHTFTVRGPAGDEAALWIGDQRADLGKLGGEATPAVTLSLTAGQPVVYRLDYRHANQPGRLQLDWEFPGTPESPVPETALQDAWGRFLTNEGQPADRWLTLTSQAREAMRKTAPAAAGQQEGTAAPRQP